MGRVMTESIHTKKPMRHCAWPRCFSQAQLRRSFMKSNLSRRSVLSRSALSVAAVASPAIAASVGASAAADPIFAALEAWRSAKAETRVAQQVVETWEERESDIIDWNSAESQAWDSAWGRELKLKYAVCKVAPTTAAGAAALVSFLSNELMFDEVTFGYDDELDPNDRQQENAVRSALSNLRQVLTGLAGGAV
jgi:hypothetical protein